MITTETVAGDMIADLDAQDMAFIEALPVEGPLPVALPVVWIEGGTHVMVRRRSSVPVLGPLVTGAPAVGVERGFRAELSVAPE